MRTSTQNYILRIYRLSQKKPHRLVGLLEEVGVKEKKGFTGIQDLWEILSHPKGDLIKSERRERREKEKK